MLDSRSRPRLLQFVGAAAFVVGLVGFVVFDWRFGSTSDPLPTAIAVVCVAVAVGWTVLGNR